MAHLLTICFVVIILFFILHKRSKKKRKFSADEAIKLDTEEKEKKHIQLMDRIMNIIEDAVYNSDSEVYFNPNKNNGLMLTEKAKEELISLGYILTIDDNQNEGSYIVRWKA